MTVNYLGVEGPINQWSTPKFHLGRCRCYPLLCIKFCIAIPLFPTVEKVVVGECDLCSPAEPSQIRWGGARSLISKKGNKSIEKSRSQWVVSSIDRQMGRSWMRGLSNGRAARYKCTSERNAPGLIGPVNRANSLPQHLAPAHQGSFLIAAAMTSAICQLLGFASIPRYRSPPKMVSSHDPKDRSTNRQSKPRTKTDILANQTN